MIKNYLYKIWKPAFVNAFYPVILAVVFVLAPLGVFAFFDYPYLNWLIDHKWAMGSMLWILFALTDATMHKYLIEDLISQNIKLKIDGHVFANIYRFFVWLGLLGFAGWQTAGCMALVFPFFQSGKLYALRNNANAYIYIHRWWSNPSNTSTAISDKFLKWWQRTLYAAIGFAALFYLHKNNLW